MLKDLLNSIEKKYNNKKEENSNYNNLLSSTTTFKNLFTIPSPLPYEESEYKINLITNNCPDINEKKAKLISQLIPQNETYLSCFYMKEILTKKEYYIILTNKYFWLINQENFGAYPYIGITCTIIKNNLMSKIILINNILIELNGNNNKIEDFINTITNQEYRIKKINKKTAYLCGITPIYQKINNIGSGISLDNNNNIIIHSKEKNYKHSLNDIENYELILDNQIYLSKKTGTSKSINSFQNNCYQMSLRFTTKQGEIISIPILESNSFGTKYESHSEIYIKSINFANTILKELNNLIK